MHACVNLQVNRYSEQFGYKIRFCAYRAARLRLGLRFKFISCMLKLGLYMAQQLCMNISYKKWLKKPCTLT